MFRVAVAGYSLLVHRGPLPQIHAEYRRRALLAEEFHVSGSDGEACLVAVGVAGDWPALVVAERFSPCAGGFDPGVLLVPETRVLFIGAGTRLLAYDLESPRRLWEYAADFGFWSWDRHGDVVLMSAEPELAAWDTAGRKLWTTFVEPPWTYRVVADTVRLDVMGRETDFPLDHGPTRRAGPAPP
jgi:hypothetical protein